MIGEWPNDEIDHVNMLRDDNRWENLRNANYTQNRANCKAYKNNKCGYKGVFRSKYKWRAMGQLNQKNIHIGYYKHSWIFIR